MFLMYVAVYSQTFERPKTADVTRIPPSRFHKLGSISPDVLPDPFNF